MASDKSSDVSSTTFIGNVWGKRARGLPVPEMDIFRPPSHEDVLYLKSRYPYIQLLSTNPQFGDSVKLKFITAKSHWTIFDYGDAMSASPGKYLFGSNYANKLNLAGEEQTDQQGGGEGSGTVLPPGSGTIIKQSVDTAIEMMQMIIGRWPGAKLISGDRLMAWVAWMEAADSGFTFEGFEPTEEEIEKRERLQKQRRAKAEAAPGMAPKR